MINNVSTNVIQPYNAEGGVSNANSSQTLSGNVFETEEKSEFKKWLDDEDKVCSDGLNDGKISTEEKATSFVKGLFGIVKSAINHPVATLLTVGAGAALTVATGGAALPFLVAGGVAIGAGQIGYGAYKAATTDSDAEAKQAYETMGNGVFSLASSVLGAKGALKSASSAGVTSAQGAENLNALQATAQCFKSTPEALKVSAANIKGNALTLTTGVVQKGSNKLQGGQQGTSKATTADVKKFDLSGSTEEVLQKYADAGIFEKDGNYYIPNKWNAQEPYLVSDGSVLMKYGDDDFAVCASNIFEKSYGTTSGYEAGNFEYSSVDSLSTDNYINATKQAKSSYVTASEGTKVQTLEGVRTVGADDVIALDVEGNPYIQPKATFIKKNDLGEIIEPMSNAQRAIRGGIQTEVDIEQ